MGIIGGNFNFIFSIIIMDDIIKAILNNDLINANKLSKEKYPFKLVVKEKRIISKQDMLKVFIRD